MLEKELVGQTIETREILDRAGIIAGSVHIDDRLNDPNLLHSGPYKQTWVDGIAHGEVVYNKYLESTMNPLYNLARIIAIQRAESAVKRKVRFD